MGTKFGHILIKSEDTKAVTEAFHSLLIQMPKPTREDYLHAFGQISPGMDEPTRVRLTDILLSIQESSLEKARNFVSEPVNGWTSVTSTLFDSGNVSGYGEQLSLKLREPILTVGYFDDDILDLTLMREGKILTRNVTCTGIGNTYGITENEKGDLLLMSEVIGLDEFSLRLCLHHPEVEEQVRALSDKLGVDLWAPILQFPETGPYRTRTTTYHLL